MYESVAMSLKRGCGTVLWDLDGTILDSTIPALVSWRVAFEAMGLPALPADQVHRVIGPPMQLVATELLAERGRTDAAAYDELVTRFRAAIEEVEVVQAVAYDGIVDVVRAVHATGRRMAIVTSKPMQSAVRVLPALGIAELFVHVEAPDATQHEPKPVTMARAAAVLQINPKDTVMIGDRHHDVDAATSEGIATIGVTWAAHASRHELEQAGAAAIADTPAQLRTLLTSV
jgi:phosphoglycolate phosphatase